MGWAASQAGLFQGSCRCRAGFPLAWSWRKEATPATGTTWAPSWAPAMPSRQERAGQPAMLTQSWAAWQGIAPVTAQDTELTQAEPALEVLRPQS